MSFCPGGIITGLSPSNAFPRRFSFALIPDCLQPEAKLGLGMKPILTYVVGAVVLFFLVAALAAIGIIDAKTAGLVLVGAGLAAYFGRKKA